MEKLTSKGYAIDVMTDGSKYDRNKVELLTSDQKLIDAWHDKFLKLIKIVENIDNDNAENLYCLKSLHWVSNYFETFKEQEEWLEQGMRFYSSVYKG